MLPIFAQANCEECVLSQTKATADQMENPCEIWFDIHYWSVNGDHIYNSPCTNLTFEWDFGDGNGSGPSNNSSVFYSYEDDGFYTACVTITAVSSTGETCVEEKCIDVEIAGCSGCCDFYMSGLSYFINPWNPCVAAIVVNSPYANDECSDYIISWDVDGDGVSDGTGTSYFGTFVGPGPHTACATMSFNGCEYEECITFELPDCPGIGDCSECVLDQTNAYYGIGLDDCTVYFDVQHYSVNGTHIYNTDCTDLTFDWDYGDGNTSGPSSSSDAVHSYENNGTYTACVTISAINSDGGECEEVKCVEVTVNGCEDCCDFYMNPVVFVQGDCNVALVASGESSSCDNYTINWTVDGDFVGSGSVVFTTVTGEVHEACATMTDGMGCEATFCTDFTTVGCPEFGGGNGDDKSFSGKFDKPMTVYPNPARDVINVAFGFNNESPIKGISIIDTSGKLISSHQPSPDNLNSMDISGLPLGIYFIQAVNENGNVMTERFVKTQ